MMVNLPDELLLSQFQVKLTSEPPVVNIYPTEKFWPGSIGVEQHFPFSEDIDMQYKATPQVKVEVPTSVKYNKKAEIEKLVAQALTNPKVRIGLKDSYDPTFDAGDIGGDPDDWSTLNTYLWVTVEEGKLARLHARKRHEKGNDEAYGDVLKHFTGKHYKGKLLPLNIGRLTTQEVMQDVLDELVVALEKEHELRLARPRHW